MKNEWTDIAKEGTEAIEDPHIKKYLLNNPIELLVELEPNIEVQRWYGKAFGRTIYLEFDKSIFETLGERFDTLDKTFKKLLGLVITSSSLLKKHYYRSVIKSNKKIHKRD